MKTILILLSITLLAGSCTLNTSPSAQVVKRDSTPVKAPIYQPDTVKIIRKTAMPDIEGTYKATALEGDETEPCNLTLKITKKYNQYFYSLFLPGKVHRGAVTITLSNDPKQFTCMLTLEGIPWASYEGDISQVDDEHPAKELEVPVGIAMGLMKNELTFQNDGNAMNAYTVLEQCGQKYVRLVKQ